MRIEDYANISARSDARTGNPECVIMGNGPSLNDVWLPNFDCPTFGTNRIYLKDYTPDFYVAVNPLVIEQFIDEIMRIPTIKFLARTPFTEERFSDKDEDVILLDTTLNSAIFASPEGPIWEGHTVTYVCLQLAYYMGFKRVYLVGLDHDYGEQIAPNLSIVANGPDRYHFDENYFSGGVRWHTPDLSKSELAYSLAKAAFEKNGRSITNCSSRTKCPVFPIEPLNYMNSVLDNKVSAIVSAYHAEDFIQGCMFDLARQTIATELEIVLIAQQDSKEIDLAMEVVADEDYPCDVRLIQTTDIPTVYAAWNQAIRSASGKYITNANTDDRHHPYAYELMSSVLDARPDLDLVYHDSFITWKPNQLFEEFVKENFNKPLIVGRALYQPGIFNWPDYERDKLVDGCFIGPHPMWRANLHQRHGYFMDHWKSAGDYEFWLRCADRDNYFHIPTTLGLYCAREDGLELGDIGGNMQEAQDAIVLHQEKEVQIRPMGDDLVRIKLDGHYINVQHKHLFGLYEKITGGE